jgi:hypothetical protein
MCANDCVISALFFTIIFLFDVDPLFVCCRITPAGICVVELCQLCTSLVFPCRSRIHSEEFFAY